MRKKEYERLLAEREDRIRQMEQHIASLNQSLDNYHEREQMIIDTMSRASVAADQKYREAEEAAKTIRRNAQREADDILERSRNECQRMEAEIQNKTAAYEDRLAEYNKTLKVAAEKAKSYAKQFAAVAGTLNIKTPNQYVQDVEQSDTLPDAEGSPQKLMHNIYKLENRVLPQSVDPDAPEEAEEDLVEVCPQENEAETEQAPAFDFLSIGIDPQEFGFDPNPPEKQTAVKPEQNDTPEMYAPVPMEPPVEPVPLETPQPMEPAEPDWDAVPRVSQFVADTNDDEEISLDTLLDEIIKAGE